MYTNLRSGLGIRNEYKDDRAIRYVHRPVNVSLVQAEYPHYSELSPPVRRFDVAILSPDQNSDLDRWHQPCRVAIEIKLWQAGEKNEGSWRDIHNKLLPYWEESKKTERNFTGIAMLFVLPGAEERIEKKKRIERISDIHHGNIQDADVPPNDVVFHLITCKEWSLCAVKRA